MSRRDTYLARRATARLKKRLIGAAFFAAAVGVIVLGLLVEPEKAIAGHSEWVVPASFVQAAPSAPAAVVAPPAATRRVYPYSIIPGGVADREELARVIQTDKVVAEHYASFGVDRAFKLTVAKPRAVYVSYRKNDKVYWTSKKLMLVKGELLLSDGQNDMRARCANRISDTPQFPVEMNEPTAEELDSVVAISMDSEALGLNDAGYAAGGGGFGPGPGQASTVALAANDAARAAGAWPETGRNNFFGPAAGSSPGTGGAPGDSDNGEQGTTPAVPPAPDGKPSTPSPEPAPDGTPSTPSTPSPEPTPGKPVTPGPDAPPSKPPVSNPPQAGKPPPGELPTGNPPGTPETPTSPPDAPEPPALPPAELPQVPGEIEHEVPEPNTLALCALAFAGMLLLRRKKPARPAR